MLKHINTNPAPDGYQWIFCRFRKVRGSSQRMLDAHEYGYHAWKILVRKKKH
ncbi:hypothetical protein [Celerinatantimonas sp. YJH-8]|uniref:hypothetical protein n=1 Tax=Celerinatantimonas sp. YJH-8 TaxID=3228714 RepID=UPI0038C40CB8